MTARAKEAVAVGFMIKSGWAAAVLLGGSRSAPRVLNSRRVEISDPDVADSAQPYHAGFGTARDAGTELARLVSLVKTYGRKSVTAVLREYQQQATVRGAGVIVGSLIDPTTIGNDHIRIHAMEGQLFRTVVIEAAELIGLKCSVCRERDLYAAATKGLKKSEATIRSTLSLIGRDVDGGWRAEQKAAALSAWMML
ncbi:MAG: hypothetical protein ABI024_02745 [Vicinamibacterales bacterium]